MPTAPIQLVPMRPLSSRVFSALYRGLKDRSAVGSINGRIMKAVGHQFLISNCIGHRTNKVLSFGKLVSGRNSIGMSVVTRDPTQRIGPAGERRRDELQDFVLHSGFPWDRPRDGRRGYWMADGTPCWRLDQLLALHFRDSMLHDAAGVRIEEGFRKDQPIFGYTPWDGSRVRLCEAKDYEPVYRDNLKSPEYVLLDAQGEVVYELAWDEFAYWVRNPQVEQEMLGYGRAELEDCLDAVTGMVTAFRYNLSQFTENRLPKGFISVPADVDENVLDEFLGTLEGNIGGPAGGWHQIPIIRADGDKPAVQWVPMGERPGDMQHRDFIMFLVTVVCGSLHMAPEEISFQGYNTKTNVMQEADPQTRIENAQDAGFNSMLHSWSDWYTSNILNRFDDGDWRLRFTLDDTDEAYEAKLSKSRIDSGLSVLDEERVWADRPLRRLPVDVGLWHEVQGKILKAQPGLIQDPDKLWAASEIIYAAAGGSFSLGTMVPMNPQATQVWQMEMTALQQAGQEAGSEDDRGFPPGAPPQPPGLMPPAEGEQPQQLQEGEEQGQEQEQPDEGQRGPDDAAALHKSLSWWQRVFPGARRNAADPHTVEIVIGPGGRQ